LECKSCHTQLIDNSQFCHICGKKQPPATRKRHHRAQSEGTITKLSGQRQKPYWARLPADYSSGIPERRSLGCFPTYKAAAEALAKAMYHATELPRRERCVTLANLYDRFIESHYFENLSQSAQGSHRSAWKHLSQCASVPVTNINKDTFQIPINNLHATGLKRETLAKVRNLSSLLCKEAMGLGLMTVNYGQLVQLPKQDSTPVKPFSTKDIGRLWDAFDAGDKDAGTVLILIYTGMRPSELLDAKIEDHLHTEGTHWYFQTGSKTKAGRNRIIPIPHVLRPVIERTVAGRQSGSLISAEQGGFYRLDNWRPRNFNPLMKKLGLEGYTPYSCRHTYADLQKRRSVTPEVLATIMGHEDYSTTVEHYFTTTDEDITRLCEAAEGLGRPTQKS